MAEGGAVGEDRRVLGGVRRREVVRAARRRGRAGAVAGVGGGGEQREGEGVGTDGADARAEGELESAVAEYDCDDSSRCTLVRWLALGLRRALL